MISHMITVICICGWCRVMMPPEECESLLGVFDGEGEEEIFNPNNNNYAYPATSIPKWIHVWDASHRGTRYALGSSQISMLGCLSRKKWRGGGEEGKEEKKEEEEDDDDESASMIPIVHFNCGSKRGSGEMFVENETEWACPTHIHVTVQGQDAKRTNHGEYDVEDHQGVFCAELERPDDYWRGKLNNDSQQKYSSLLEAAVATAAENSSFPSSELDFSFVTIARLSWQDRTGCFFRLQTWIDWVSTVSVALRLKIEIVVVDWNSDFPDIYELKKALIPRQNVPLKVVTATATVVLSGAAATGGGREERNFSSSSSSENITTTEGEGETKKDSPSPPPPFPFPFPNKEGIYYPSWLARGAVEAYDAGIQEAKGRFLIFSTPDDILNVEIFHFLRKFSNQLRVCESSPCPPLEWRMYRAWTAELSIQMADGLKEVMEALTMELGMNPRHDLWKVRTVETDAFLQANGVPHQSSTSTPQSDEPFFGEKPGDIVLDMAESFLMISREMYHLLGGLPKTAPTIPDAVRLLMCRAAGAGMTQSVLGYPAITHRSIFNENSDNYAIRFGSSKQQQQQQQQCSASSSTKCSNSTIETMPIAVNFDCTGGGGEYPLHPVLFPDTGASWRENEHCKLAVQSVQQDLLQKILSSQENQQQEQQEQQMYSPSRVDQLSTEISSIHDKYGNPSPSPSSSSSSSSSEKVTCSRNYILGLADRVLEEDGAIGTFVGSLRRSGSAADVILLSSQLRSKESNILNRLSVFVDWKKELHTSKKDTMFLGSLRFYMYQKQMQHSVFSTCNGWTLLTDVRDVFFQRDPFEMLNTNTAANSKHCSSHLFQNLTSSTIFLAMERGSIGSCKHNSAWISACYPDFVASNNLENLPISCSGTVLGHHVAIGVYLHLMVSEMDRFEHSPPLCLRSSAGIDQGIHNYLLHSGAMNKAGLDVRILDGRCRAAFIATIGREPFRVDPIGRVTDMYGHLPAIVHQYDRFPWLRDDVKIRHRLVPVASVGEED